MNRLIIMGSPRSHGRCAALAEVLFDTYIEQYPHDAIFLAPISELTLDFLHKQLPNATAPLPLAEPSAPAQTLLAEAEANVPAQTSVLPAQIQDASAQPGATQLVQPGSTHQPPRVPDACAAKQLDEYAYLFECSDDMKELYAQLNSADELIIVSPVYFSGAPAEFKVLLDRMQPYYLRNRALGVEKAAYKPAILHIVGEGGDPHGFKALASEVKSAFSQAGFAVSRVLNWVGCISEDSSILHDPCDIEDAVFGDERTHQSQSEQGCDSKNKRGLEQARECERAGKRAGEPAGEYPNEPTHEFADELAPAPQHAPASAPAHTRPKLSLSGDTSVHASQRAKRKATSVRSANNASTSSGTKGTARAKNANRPAKKSHALSASNTSAASRTPRASKKGKNRG